MAIGGKGDFPQWVKPILQSYGEIVHSWLRNAAGKKNVKSTQEQ
jgi:hypothetical protein